MRRRTRFVDGDGSGIPAHLLNYDPANWVGGPGVDCRHPPCAYWRARDVFREEHPELEDAWPIVADGPDVPWHPEWI